MADKGRPLPKFGEWDVNDPASAEGFTVIFNKARNEKRTGGKIESPGRKDATYKQGAVLGKPQSNPIKREVLSCQGNLVEKMSWQFISLEDFVAELASLLAEMATSSTNRGLLSGWKCSVFGVHCFMLMMKNSGFIDANK
ncbi:Pathogenic type III effector avirulence factor Avr cleavage site [Corchorus olitorius]|uniref:Pathogenic type III effector avirulence factor Avr cleavage site n=1 Tax=Corchorus olitorius TaxID=93759 RepID=A0A1R3JTR1_9ROSI|nr:Pathogenic type III effector avirulence factor Avr cleavage site [Corchorus olitorius]